MKVYSSFAKKMVMSVTVVGFSLSAMAMLIASGTVPNIFNPGETQFQHETHFLVPNGGAPESAVTARAYYTAIDPTSSKANFPQWLVNAGFISDPSQWHPSGKQLIACNLPGCDLPAGMYGDNIINTDSHAIVLNAADLGFVRNQFIRCVPSCSAPNPIIYTYLENYPVNPFAASGAGGSGFPIKTGYPTQAESTAAIQSALTRPLGNLASCDPTQTDTPFACSIQRIADVAFEWAPPAARPSSSSRFGQLYAYVFDTSTGPATETITVPASLVGKEIPDFVTHGLTTIKAGDPFPPNLDFLGFKQHPGTCFICHGGSTQKLTATGAYPKGGNVSGFRFLPLDVRNLIFTSDLGSEPSSRFNQEPQLKLYNQAVLRTVTAQAESDDSVVRVPHLREVILGWYAGFPGDTNMTASVQNSDFVPAGWLEPTHGGTAPSGSEHLYQNTVGPSCRSCHFNRELSLDFGTAANFTKVKSDVLELALLPLCNSNNPGKGTRPMPLAHLTYQRFWEANTAAGKVLPSGQPPLTISNTADDIANYFGYSGVNGYCATNP